MLSFQGGLCTCPRIFLDSLGVSACASCIYLLSSLSLASRCWGGHLYLAGRSRVNAIVGDGSIPACSPRHWRSGDEVVILKTMKVHWLYCTWSQQGRVCYRSSSMFCKVNEGTWGIRDQDSERFFEKTFIILRVGMQRYCCPSGVYEPTRAKPLALLFAKTDISEIGCSVVTLATRMTCSCSSVPTADTPLSTMLVVLIIFRASTDASCSISIGAAYELYETIFITAGEFLFTNLSMKYVPRRTDTAQLLTTPSTTRTLVSPIST